MVANLAYNYMPTVGAPGAFTIQTDGVVQGTQYDDPETRYSLRAGLLSQLETVPMWGGVLIYEQIPSLAAGQPAEQLGNIVGRATTLTKTSATGASAFALFNQAHHMPITTQNAVPLAASGMSVNYQRLGSGARIAVACDPSLVSLETGSVGQQVSWDFNAQVLQPYDAATATFAVTSLTWANTAGGRIAVVMATPLTTVGAVGDSVTFSGATNTGTGGAAAVNRTFVVDTFASTSAFTVAAPDASGLVYGTIAGTILAQAGVGALDVRVDRILPTGCMTVNYNSITGQASWNYNGCCALLTI